jgi:hypothetical protein
LHHSPRNGTSCGDHKRGDGGSYSDHNCRDGDGRSRNCGSHNGRSRNHCLDDDTIKPAG